MEHLLGISLVLSFVLPHTSSLMLLVNPLFFLIFLCFSAVVLLFLSLAKNASRSSSVISSKYDFGCTVSVNTLRLALVAASLRCFLRSASIAYSSTSESNRDSA